MNTATQTHRVIARTVGVLGLVISITWLWYEPGFEPVLGILGSIASIIQSLNEGISTLPRRRDGVENSSEVTASVLTVADQEFSLVFMKLKYRSLQALCLIISITALVSINMSDVDNDGWRILVSWIFVGGSALYWWFLNTRLKYINRAIRNFSNKNMEHK